VGLRNERMGDHHHRIREWAAAHPSGVRAIAARERATS
jgi:hypothetical protein